jgi:hypothetical protein
MPANSGRDGSGEEILILTRSAKRLSHPQPPCSLIGSLTRAYPLVEYVAVLVVR